MFRQFSHQLVHGLLQAKEMAFNPLPLSSLSQIMSLQAFTFTRLVLRLNTSQEEYQGGRISFTFPKQRLAYLWTVANWITDLGGYLAFFHFLSVYAHIYGLGLGLEDYEKFALSSSIVYTFFEYIWWTQLGPILSDFRNDALDFLYAYVDQDSTLIGLSKSQEASLVDSFNRQHRIACRYCGIAILGILVQLPNLLALFICSISPCNLGLFEVMLYIFMAIHNNVQGIYVVIFVVTFANQGFLMMRLFKGKLTNALLLLRPSRSLSSTLSPLTLRKFTVAYLSLNREICLYNAFMCKFIFMTDMALKLAGSIALTYFFKSGNLLSNFFGLSTTLFLLVFYIAINQIFTLFSVFPEENLNAYRAISRFNAKIHGRRVRTQSRSLGLRPAAICFADARQALRVNGLLQFLGSRQFGFTYSRQYVIEKKNMVDNVFSTIYYFLLFLKRHV